MSISKVKEYLKKYNMHDRVIELSESSASVEEAAKALSTIEAKIAKTISLKIDDRTILIVASGDMKINNVKYKARFNKKARMLSADEVEELTGFVVGGVCPFTDKKGVEKYLDVSLKRFNRVYPACGTRNSAIDLTLEELELASEFIDYVDVCQIKD